MICRVCGSENVQLAGALSPYADVSVDIYDCGTCRCRFAPHDDSIHDKLHATGAGGYTIHDVASQQANSFCQRGDLAGLRRFLLTRSTYRFVIEQIERHQPVRDIAEFGCSCGALSSYFIKSGYEFTGVDVSAHAVSLARERFGPHFSTLDEFAELPSRTFDAVFHTGTIGCVEDPLRFTNELLDLVRPGGLLVFNCPNVELCHLQHETWIPGARPPDLVTLFDARMWENMFHDQARVNVDCRRADPKERLALFASSIRNESTKESLFRAADGSEHQQNGARGAGPRAGIATAARSVVWWMLNLTRAGWLLPPLPAKYGMFVTMVRNERD